MPSPAPRHRLTAEQIAAIVKGEDAGAFRHCCDFAAPPPPGPSALTWFTIGALAMLALQVATEALIRALS